MPASSKIRYYQTGIQTLDALLLPITRKKGAADDCRGLAFYPDIGFFGAIFGSAGSGKSILAMQMAAVCGGGMRLNADEPQPKLIDTNGAVKKIKDFSAVYITQEAPDLIEAKIGSFGWIKKPDICRPGKGPFLELDKGGLHLANFDLNPEAQTGMLRNIFDSVARSTKDRPERFTLICFDNAETILSAAYTEVVGSSPMENNFYKTVRDFCKKRQLHLMMFFEEREHAIEDRHSTIVRQEVATTSQAYAADLVIRLGSHDFPSGYKERSLEVVKAKNQFHRRGSHHFSIVPGGKGTESSTGFVIYESLPTQLYKLRYPRFYDAHHKVTLNSSTPGNFGIESLDEGIKKVIAKLSDRTAPSNFLNPGSVSVLVCDLDVRTSEIALHFAFRPKDEDTGTAIERPVPPDAVYISFLNPWESLRKGLNNFSIKAFQEKSPENFVCFDPEHISEGKLLRDIRCHIEQAQSRLRRTHPRNQPPLRVVVDNLYGLDAKFPLIQNTAHFITALIAQLRDLNVIALVLDTVEVGEGRNPLDKSFAAGLGQNVFLLRHVELHSRAHTAFSVVQILGHQTPETLWDIVDDQGNLRAQDTFKYYKSVLSGRPELVKVRMSLHADAKDSPLDNYLKEKSKALQQSLGNALELYRYRPEHYAHVHGAFSLARHQPLSDCHVISIDETWLEDLLMGDDLEEISPSGRYSGAVTTCHDLALWYQHRQHGRDESCLGHVYAIPERNNCGVMALCDNSLLMKSKQLYKSVRAFAGGSATSWQQLRDLKVQFHTAIDGEIPPAGHRNPLFFTFCRDQAESCVSFMLELALACVPKGNRLVDKDRKLILYGARGRAEARAQVWRDALSLFVSLLEPIDREEIAKGKFRKSVEEPGSVFSRQWFNTCIVLRSRTTDGDPKEFSSLTIHELPRGRNKVPAVVSGAWYFGILKGSAAVAAGVEVMSQFTSPEEASPGEDLRKANLGIGLPVRGEYYGFEKQSIELIHRIPYRERFHEISRIDTEGGLDRVENIAEDCEREFPFYRMRIGSYRHVMPIIWGMMVQAAAHAKLATRPGEFVLERNENQDIRQEAQRRYDTILEAIS